MPRSPGWSGSAWIIGPELRRDQHCNRTALVRRARAQLAAWFHGWNDDKWDEWIKRDIATGEFDAILRELDDGLKAGRLRDMPRNPERIGGSGIASASCGGKYH